MTLTFDWLTPKALLIISWLWPFILWGLTLKKGIKLSYRDNFHSLDHSDLDFWPIDPKSYRDQVLDKNWETANFFSSWRVCLFYFQIIYWTTLSLLIEYSFFPGIETGPFSQIRKNRTNFPQEKGWGWLVKERKKYLQKGSTYFPLISLFLIYLSLKVVFKE